MPDLRLENHKLAAGIRTPSYMDSTALRLLDFPLQADQDNGFIQWPAPSYNLGSTWPDYARYRADGNEIEDGDGPQILDWVFWYFTNDMLAYWKTTFPHGSDVTLLTYDQQDTPIYLTAIILHPRAPTPRDAGHMKWAPGGWSEIRWRFRQGRNITP
jgi:hypothetical protein